MPIGHKIMRLKRNMVFNFRKLLPLRRFRQTWLEAIISLRNLNYMVFSKPAKFLVFSFTVMFNILCTLVQFFFSIWYNFLFYARQRNFTHLGTIFTLCASAQFHAPWYDFYFMRFDAIIILCASAQFYAMAIFVMGRLLPR